MGAAILVCRNKKKARPKASKKISWNKKASIRFYKHWNDKLRRKKEFQEWTSEEKKKFIEDRMKDFHLSLHLANTSEEI